VPWRLNDADVTRDLLRGVLLAGAATIWLRPLATGIFGSGCDELDELLAIGEGRNDSLRHRGPDDGGIWVDAKMGVLLGHHTAALSGDGVAGYNYYVWDNAP
jgi:hypothetical protein